MRLRQLQQMFSYHARWTSRFAAHDVHCVFDGAVRDLEAHGFGTLRGKQVLDLGCGPLYACSLQCAASGARVTALDARYVHPGPLLKAFGRSLIHDGIRESVKLVARRALFAREYYRTLEAEAGRALRRHESDISFVTCDPGGHSYPLEQCTFDLVLSNAVLEHVADVPAFVREVHRVLKPGGYFHAMIHNFYSLSGGHCPEWAYPDTDPSDRVPPWDHLREHRFPATCFLNQLKPEDYLGALSACFDVLLFEGRDIDHSPGGLEGEAFLAGPLVDELGCYPRELLLTRCWCAVCRRRARSTTRGEEPC